MCGYVRGCFSVDCLSFLDVQIFIAYDMHNWLSSLHNSMYRKQNHIEEDNEEFLHVGMYHYS